jgi:aerobic carbon-monoxide dehydrogenase small subunit
MSETPEGQAKSDISFTVNGKLETVHVYPMERLLDVLRHELRLTGTKEGCGEGECGSCSVLVDGTLVNSCLIPALQAEGAKIVTIEGLASDGRLELL